MGGWGELGGGYLGIFMAGLRCDRIAEAWTLWNQAVNDLLSREGQLDDFGQPWQAHWWPVEGKCDTSNGPQTTRPGGKLSTRGALKLYHFRKRREFTP